VVYGEVCGDLVLCMCMCVCVCACDGKGSLSWSVKGNSDLVVGSGLGDVCEM
jgi:hypothetical protein